MGVKVTIRPERIQKWVEEREGKPAHLRGAPWLLRVWFPHEETKATSRNYVPVEWEQFFQVMKERDLAFKCSTQGESRFYELVDGLSAEDGRGWEE